MSFQVDTAKVQKFRNELTHLSQQMESRLGGAVRRETQNAERQHFDRLDSVSAVEITTRHGDTPYTEVPHDRRSVTLKHYAASELCDTQDKLEMLINPTGGYVEAFVRAMNRQKDQVIIDAATGSADTGKTGTTAVTFATEGNEVAVDYTEGGAPALNSNLTIGKLRKANSILGVNEAVMDGEETYAIVSQSQIDSLLRTVEVTSDDYNTIRALVSGKIDTFMGFKFIRIQLLNVASSIRDCIFYAKSGLLLSTAEELFVDIGPRRDKNLSIQAYVRASFGSVRMEGKKVIRVKCDETV
jgi:hypothetical protein